jgi:hypothetical protein
LVPREFDALRHASLWNPENTLSGTSPTIRDLAALARWGMIPKSGNRFSEKIMLDQNDRQSGLKRG